MLSKLQIHILVPLMLFYIVGCSSSISGAYLVVPNKPMVKIDPAKINAIDYEYRLAPKDVLLIQVEQGQNIDEKYKIERGNQLRVDISPEIPHDSLYKLVPGDTLTLEVIDDIESQFQVPIGPDGRVTLPKVGKSILAAGLTLSELNTRSAREYKNLFISPRVSWTITRYFVEEVSKLSGDYNVGIDGEVIIPKLGKFEVLGKVADDVAILVANRASSLYKNKIHSDVSVAQLINRNQFDSRITPSGSNLLINTNNTTSRISESGTVYVPNIGDVIAQGKTITEFKQSVIDKFKLAYKNPINVSVAVQEYAENSVFIGGEVRQPGRYPYAQKLSLLKLIAQAGWGNEFADLGNVLLLRPSGEKEYTIYRTNLSEVLEGKGEKSQDLKVTPQDLIIIPPTGIAKANRYISQYIKGILPFGTNVSYNINAAANTTTK